MKYEQLRNAEAIADAVIWVKRRILSLQDVAAAAAVYSRAVERGEGTFFSFNA